jgi:hypothetical protein
MYKILTIDMCNEKLRDYVHQSKDNNHYDIFGQR